jgi:ABC-type transport system involved in multi-copper enzyme maturation permease subunit
MRMLGAELLKLRRRRASYIVLGLLIGLMALVFLLAAATDRDGLMTLRFPTAYGVINQFVFGLGSLLAVAYAAAIAGADWSWGIFGTVVARGESRARYVLAKAAGLAVALIVGVLVAYLAGIALTYLVGLMGGRDVGAPLAGSGGRDLLASIGLGSVVVLERAAIGFAVAILLRSQLAGIVVGIVLYIGEAILGAVLFAMSFAAGSFLDGSFEPRGPEWYQYLPFTIGDSVLAAGPTVAGGGNDLEGLLMRPVPVEVALIVTALYLVAALALCAVSARRAQITGSSG